MFPLSLLTHRVTVTEQTRTEVRDKGQQSLTTRSIRDLRRSNMQLTFLPVLSALPCRRLLATWAAV
jgi:hypothetical protein